MTVIGIILGSLFGIFAVILIISGALAWRAKLPGNRYIGIRVPEVRKSQDLWDIAHRVAGPLWVLSGISWAIAALVTFTATGWMWLVPLLGVLGGLVFLGMGAGMGAHTVAMVDSMRTRDENANTSSPDTSIEKAPTAKPVAVDFEALRRAAKTNQDK